MGGQETHAGVAGVMDYLQIFQRRKWPALITLVLVPAVAVALALRQPAVYQTSADVLLRSQSLPSALSGISDPSAPSSYVDPFRLTGTQIQVALLPAMADRVVRSLPRLHLTSGEVLGSISVQPLGNTDFLRFVATNHNPALATRIATAYARQYTLYRTQLDTSAAAQALSDLQRRIAKLSTSTDAASRAATLDLQTKSDQLQTFLTLTKANAVLVRAAGTAVKIRPRPIREGALGFGLGLILAIGLALLLDLADTRLRSSSAIEQRLELPLLARLSAPPRQLRRNNKLTMLADPRSASGEAFRMLRTNLEFVTLERQAQVLMVISASEGEGKSTTISNLGVALALAGRKVIILDLDLRKPSLDVFFPSQERRLGLTDVVVGRATLDQALSPIAIQRSNDVTSRASTANLNGHAGGAAADLGYLGQLHVLTTGPLPPDPGEFVGLQGVKSVVSDLRLRADVILIDTPPMLQVGDAKVIARFADASVLVLRAELATRPLVSELVRALTDWPANPVGYVLCGADALEDYSYSQYGYYAQEEARRRDKRASLPVQEPLP
jgi:polysaccharide biosynthesis transport protein